MLLKLKLKESQPKQQIRKSCEKPPDSSVAGEPEANLSLPKTEQSNLSKLNNKLKINKN